jgi:hypothetical protein
MLPKYHRQLAEEYSFIMGAEAPKGEEPAPSIARRIAVGAAPRYTHSTEGYTFLGCLDGSDLYERHAIGADGATYTVGYASRFGDEEWQIAESDIEPPQGSVFALARTLFKRGVEPSHYTMG